MKKTIANSYIYQSTMNGTREKPYAGTILDILEVDFGSFNNIVLEVRWHKSIMSPPERATMVMDECGFYRVSIGHVAPRGTALADTIVFPHFVDQCMMIPMRNMTGWSIVIPVFPRQRMISPPEEDDDET